jgi:hypothetical protein
MPAGEQAGILYHRIQGGAGPYALYFQLFQVIDMGKLYEDKRHGSQKTGNNENLKQ